MRRPCAARCGGTSADRAPPHDRPPGLLPARFPTSHRKQPDPYQAVSNAAGRRPEGRHHPLGLDRGPAAPAAHGRHVGESGRLRATVRARPTAATSGLTSRYLEVWLEKDALSGIFEDVLRRYGVTLNVGRGYDGWDSIQNAAGASRTASAATGQPRSSTSATSTRPARTWCARCESAWPTSGLPGDREVRAHPRRHRALTTCRPTSRRRPTRGGRRSWPSTATSPSSSTRYRSTSCRNASE